MNRYLLEIGGMNLVSKNVRRNRLKESAQSKKGAPDIFFLKETHINLKKLQNSQTILILIFYNFSKFRGPTLYLAPDIKFMETALTCGVS
jgi:hypothetical protein